MVNTCQFSGLTYMQDMTKSHTFSAKNQGSTYTLRNTVILKCIYHLWGFFIFRIYLPVNKCFYIHIAKIIFDFDFFCGAVSVQIGDMTVQKEEKVEVGL